MKGARITDAVAFHKKRGEGRGAVRLVQGRRPDGFRWRKAVANLNHLAGGLRGLDRMRIEEPIREVIVDLHDQRLQKEVVIDARRFNVDLDRGELLPMHTMGDLRRYAFLVGADVGTIERYVALPDDFGAPVDTAACILVGRAMANHHRDRAQRVWLELPDQDVDPWLKHHHIMAARAREDAALSKRWDALAVRLLAG